MKNKTITSLAELKKRGFPVTGEMRDTEKQYPVRISEYYLALIDKEHWEDDPIRKQCIPSIEEIQDSSSSHDPLHEEKQMPVSRLIHRYPDRVVLVTTNRCPMYCRFCFRKRYWKKDKAQSDITVKELNDAVRYLESNPGIREVLVSGGEPLTMNNDKIRLILDKIYSVKTIEAVRIASRIPITLPDRIDSRLATLLSSYNGLWFVTHFNHPAEITQKSMTACGKLIKRGIPVLNQTVLLKGVNDDPVILENLFRMLVKNRIKPLYLFHVDPVRGVRHFSTGINKGLEILRYFRRNVSSLATPHFAIDLPEGGGKVSLQPDYTHEGKFISINEDKLIEYK